MAIVTDDGAPQAVVRTQEKAIGVRVGDEIAGWKVTQIEPRRLVLASDYREVSFDLFGRMSGKGKYRREQGHSEKRKSLHCFLHD